MSTVCHLIGGEMHGSSITIEDNIIGSSFRVAEPARSMPFPSRGVTTGVFRCSTYNFVKSIYNPALGRTEYIAVHEDWHR